MHAELAMLEGLLELERHPLVSDAVSELCARTNPAQQGRHEESTRRELCMAETMGKAGAHLMSPHRGWMIIAGCVATATAPASVLSVAMRAVWHEGSQR